MLFYIIAEYIYHRYFELLALGSLGKVRRFRSAVGACALFAVLFCREPRPQMTKDGPNMTRFCGILVVSLYGCPRSDDCGASVGRLSSLSWLLRPADESVRTDELDGKMYQLRVLEI